MQESQIIKDYRTKLKSGITELENCFYIPVRITGTGKTTRFEGYPTDEVKDGEPFVEERLKSEYFTPAALEHCARLPILLDHPKDGLLNSNNLKDNAIIGQTVDSWIQGDEIWGLARVYDKTLLSKLGDQINSTSPGISIFHSIITNEKVTEGPVEINHLAFVDKGHWDQIEGSVGYDNSKLERMDKMSEKLEEIPKVIPINDVESPVVKARNDNEVETLDSTPKLDEEEKMDNEEVKKDNATEVLDAEEPIEVTDEDIEILDDEIPVLDDFGPEHHEQPSEVHADDDVEILDSGEDEEVLDSEDVEEEDKEREDALEEIRNTCDSAHPSLGIKMPHISKRETKRSVVSKFMSRNRAFVSSKYQNMRIDSMNSELAGEILKDMISNIQTRSDKLQVKKISGFVPSKYGAVDRNF